MTDRDIPYMLGVHFSGVLPSRGTGDLTIYETVL